MESAIGKLRSAQPSLTSGFYPSLPPTCAAKAPDTVLFLVLAARALKRCRAPSKNSALCWVRHKRRGPPEAASFWRNVGQDRSNSRVTLKGTVVPKRKIIVNIGTRTPHSADPKKSRKCGRYSTAMGFGGLAWMRADA